MMRQMTSAAVALLVFTACLMAADKDIKGKIVKVDPAKKTITVQTDDGKKDYSTTTDTNAMPSRRTQRSHHDRRGATGDSSVMPRA